MDTTVKKCWDCKHHAKSHKEEPCDSCLGVGTTILPHFELKAEPAPFKGLETAYDSPPPAAQPAPQVQLDLPGYINTLTPDPSALDVQVSGTHYKNLVIQPIEYIHANNIPFAEGSVIKYVTRWRNKNGIKDLEKAKHFIELLIELEKRNPDA